MTLTPTLTIEIMNALDLKGDLWQTCRSHTFSDGWMARTTPNLKRGYAIDKTGRRRDLKLPTGHAMIARVDGEFAGWAVSRHREDDGTSDFNVWTKSKFRGKMVASELLRVGHENFGRLAVFPWDYKSSSFYEKNHELCSIHHTTWWSDLKFREWDVYW